MMWPPSEMHFSPASLSSLLGHCIARNTGFSVNVVTRHRVGVFYS